MSWWYMCRNIPLNRNSFFAILFFETFNTELKERFKFSNIGEVKLGKTGRFAAIGIIIFSLNSSTPQRLDAIVNSHKFDIFSWEVQNLPPKVLGKINESVTDVIKQRKPRNPEEEAAIVEKFFAPDPHDINIETEVEKILEGQITDVIKEEGISSIIPVMFKFIDPAKSLIASPRDKIKIDKQVPLKTNIKLEDIENLENEIFSQYNLSALVVENGGWATFPPVIVRNTDLRGTLKIISHEWLHHYLLLKPLGRAYLLHFLGIQKNDETANINETLADIVGDEIGQKVFEKYYEKDKKQDVHQEGVGTQPFDFNKEMKEIRIQVEKDLKDGEVEQAEQFMEHKREQLSSRGYEIRKLNQAYFAFNGNYADGPNPVYETAEQMSKPPEQTSEQPHQVLSPTDIMKKLREQSKSLKDFLEKAAEITSIDQLKKVLEK